MKPDMMQTEPERQTRKESSRTRQDVDRQHILMAAYHAYFIPVTFHF